MKSTVIDGVLNTLVNINSHLRHNKMTYTAALFVYLFCPFRYLSTTVASLKEYHVFEVRIF
jgi:hypothetical protein